MKKIICILLSLILAMGILTGCDINATNDPEETPKESGSQTPADSPEDSPAESEEKNLELPCVGAYIDLTEDKRAEIEAAWNNTGNNGIELKHQDGALICETPIVWYDPNEKVIYNDQNSIEWKSYQLFDRTRYYGEIIAKDRSTYDVIYVRVIKNTEMSMGYEWLEIGGLRIYSRFIFDILLHKDGKFITLTKAYEEGIISLQNIVGITVIHYNYDEQIHHKLDKCTYCLYPISFNIKDV